MGRRSLLSVALATSLTVAGAGTAFGAPSALPSECAQSGRTVTCTYGPGTSTFTAPEGVTSLQVSVAGAAGGEGNSRFGPRSAGGPGSLLTGTLTYAGGPLSVVVGAAGAVPADNSVGGSGGAGYGAGGRGGGTRDNSGGGGGGGGSALLSDASAVVVAGGGGGAGGSANAGSRFDVGGAGGAGGQPGGTGSAGPDGSRGATGGAVGGGSGVDGGPGGTSELFNGGGGGGGGLPGGGGGSAGVESKGGGGGAGGGDLTPAGVTRTGTNAGAGQITISYEEPIAVAVAVKGAGTLTATDGKRYSLSVDARATAAGQASGRFAFSGGGAETTASSRTITAVRKTATGSTVTGTAVTAAGKQVPFTLTVVDRAGGRDQVTVQIGSRTVSGTLTNGDITSS